MVNRYVCIEGYNLDDEHGDWVRYDDYAALEARMTGIISGVQLELEDERKKRLAAEARVSGLEKDAARYRWARMQGNREVAATLLTNRMNADDAFDEAMSREA